MLGPRNLLEEIAGVGKCRAPWHLQNRCYRPYSQRMFSFRWGICQASSLGSRNRARTQHPTYQNKVDKGL
ncbi:hypothetical protein O181_006992 [Austropuccinia psidii MF-1]|uniref:Uncharacterized protein n=1 Tax=Austropuccinia psidii MF-1 TaxID=1389203 RepID=A0A9Q3GI24_9BASI|nr:hypothetical protein [Austropuccinia psidii MF-1]